MSYPLNYPTPQYANVQIFNAGQTPATQSWVKPQGASFVWFTLIGAGGAGGSTDTIDDGGGGGSGAVTNCLMPAFLIPDELQIQVGNGSTSGGGGGTATIIRYTSKSTYTLLTANNGSAGTIGVGGNGGTISNSNYFSAAGFFQSVAGQNGLVNGAITASTTTFLSGGTTQGNIVTANYGYSVGTNNAGFFQMQPIIVGVGSSKDSTSGTTKIGNGIGCGGGGGTAIANTLGSNGGNGLVVIISW